jgi:DNA repair protein RecN (Recombination protein N)
LCSLLDRLISELEIISGGNIQIEQLRLDIHEFEKEYDRLAKKISKARAAACRTLAASITQHLPELGLEQAIFRAELLPLDGERRGRFGSETVAFFASTSPELEPGPLEKVASGGELSRISLAVQVVTSQAGGVPSSIYDEVDIGIGGRIAEIVGNKLRALGMHKQVLCITHLPQVAVQGTDHLQVSKQNGNGTEILVESLNQEQRVVEIARMLGGIEITEETRAHAADMLKRAAN